MRHLFDRPLGACAPNGSLFKCNAAAAAIGGDLASALIGGWFSARNTENAAVLQHNSNRILQKWQQQYTQQNMADQYKYDMWAWNENNQYNSPRAQMERLRSAGLNPYLVQQGASGGSMPQTPAPNTHVGPQGASASSPAVQPAQMPRLNAGQLIMEGAQIKNQQIEAFAKLVDVAPRLFQAVGSDAGTRILESVFGQTVNSDDIKRIAQAGVVKDESDAAIAQVRSQMDKIWSPKEREQKWALGEQAISESFARVGKMASDVKVNEATIDKFASECVRNVAEAWKLRKEGEKYVADALTANALRGFLVSQARSRANLLSLDSYLSGAEDGTDIYDWKHSGKHAKQIVDSENIEGSWQSDRVWKAVDRFFNQYIKVMGSAPSEGHSKTTTYYHE